MLSSIKRRLDLYEMMHTNDIIHVKDNIYLSNYYTACDPQVWKQYGIKHIINLSGQSVRTDIPSSDMVDIHNINNIMDKSIRSREEENKYIMRYINIITTYVNCEGTVLINCHAGVNRSVLLICLILCIKYSYSPQEAKDYMVELNKNRGRPALTNIDFSKLLVRVHSLLNE
jgi:protein tyrosine/serine phosphatase